MERGELLPYADRTFGEVVVQYLQQVRSEKIVYLEGYLSLHMMRNSSPIISRELQHHLAKCLQERLIAKQNCHSFLLTKHNPQYFFQILDR